MAEGPEYELKPLREEAGFTFYRGRKRSDQLPVLAVAAAAEQPSPQSLRRLEHEFTLARELDARWAAQPLALTRHEGRSVLILRDPGGEALDRVVERHGRQPVDLTRFLRIAIGLSAALGQTHRQGVVHKDIKPANALVDESGNARLTGFGIASRIPRERLAPSPPEVMAGTLAYMSPEQTGRMNRSMDSRSDLYSLGVTLYQLLTGSLPFAAADPLEWVHCHIARQPAAPMDRRPVPAALSTIIMRLLAKNAEDRYQTATGVEADLQRCLTQWQLHARIDPFLLGADDSPDRLLIPEKLYGREREVDALLTAFDRVVAQGDAEIVLVSGYSGVGKSSLVNELHRVLVPPRGLFVAGKFDQYRRDIPYATLAQAFQILVRQILMKIQADLDRWRQALLHALAPNGQLIVDLIPELEFVIGKQPPVADLPPQEARHRFQSVLRRFVGAFATAEHPLALFLDDLQWLDTATLEWLESLMSDPQVRHLLLIGAYRDNEVGSAHPLIRTLTTIREAGAKTQELMLAPLGLEDLERLVADALRCGRESPRPLAQLLHEKTGGNPFFAVQFLTALSEEGLLWFDHDASGWTWDPTRIRAKGYSDNVVDLMVEKLRRLPDTAQNALQQFACLGNTAEIATLSMVFGQSEGEIQASLLEAVRTGLILRLEGSYAFLHDRIQEAAYALIPESRRAETHLRIGRALLASLADVGLAEHLFDVASQLNRGSVRVIDHDEKVQVAAIDLKAGRKAKASAAHASAREYFAAGMALLEAEDWSGQYDLMFGLLLERAECELFTGDLDTAGRLIDHVLPHAASKVDEAAALCLKVQLLFSKFEHSQAVATALTCLRGFGIDLPAHPSERQVQAEHEAVLRALDGRSIESLIDLPLLTDPELRAAMQVLSVLTGPAYLTDFNLGCLQTCRQVKISLEHGASSASPYAYAVWGSGPGLVFHRYDEAYRFARLACRLVEKHGFVASQAQVYVLMGMVAAWTRSTATAIDFNRKAILAATESGDVTFACFCMILTSPYLLLRNDALDLVWRESEVALGFIRKVKLGDTADIIVCQQRFIATMQGRTTSLSTFSDGEFDEAAFETQLTAERAPLLLCWYWIYKLKARFLSCDFAGALAAARRAKPVLQPLNRQIALLDYFFYTALTVSALYETSTADEQPSWRELLREHQEQLREWAENCPPTFADKHALVLAEIARLEKRDVDALQFYEQAIQLAREHGFVQNEGLAHELAAQHYLARGLETAGHAYLRNARNCYDRWGAHGKVKQLDERYPRLREERALPSSAATGQPPPQLDVETVVKASQALSSEMALPRLIERLMRIALEHAGAERGLLILIRSGEPRIEAEATTAQGSVEVVVRRGPVTPSCLPQSMLRYVIRTQEQVLLDDAWADPVYSRDEHVRLHRSRSVLCLPIVKQTSLVGALYLEKNLTSGAFTPDRVAVLQLLASQAAISLENAALYADLQRSETFLTQGQRVSHTGSFGWSVASGEFYWSQEMYSILEYDRGVQASLEVAVERMHPDDRDSVRKALDDAVMERRDFDSEHRLLMPDGRVKYVHTTGRSVNNGALDFVGTVREVTERMRAEEDLRQAHGDLARINRVTTMGELAASLAHEISQPLTGIVTNASVSQRRLAGDEPDLGELRTANSRLLRDALRATEIVNRIRSQFEKGAVKREALDMGEIVRDTVALLRHEAARYNISVRTELAADLPPIVADRVQLQQVAMNLIVNAIEATKEVEGIREMVFKSQRSQDEQVLVSVGDTGTGFPPQLEERMFDPFFTTKLHGTGMGLRISRSIIESHGGRLWAESASGRGATFHLSLPAAVPGRT
jgi:PAS domain S-box-containing protein